MVMLDLSEWVVVFDLDDMLYHEDDYNKSGVIAVADELVRLYGQDFKEQLLDVRESKGDVWGSACESLSLPVSVKDSLLWLYRLHRPEIELGQHVKQVVRDVASLARQVVILTDGRSITQRMKLAALGLMDFPVYISEEHSSSKPEELRFRLIMTDYPAGKYVYIADNPAKDFVAPNRLGWKTIGVRDSGRNVHSQSVNGLADEYLPDVWVNELAGAVEYLC